MEVRFGLQLPHDPVDLILKAAIFADKSGFNSVFTPDHLVGVGIKNWDAFEAFTLLAAISQQTGNVVLGTCVSDVLRKNPAVVAQSAITLDWLSKRDVVLGLGAGEGMNLVPYGISTKFLASKLEEGAEIIRKLLDGEVVNFNGKFFKMKNATIPKSKKKVKLWIAGNQKRTMLITAKYGDGWIPTASIGSKRYREGLRFIRENSNREIEPALFAYIVVDYEEEKARKMIELPAKFISLLSPLRNVFLEKAEINEKELPFPNLLEFAFNEENVKKVLEFARKIPFELVEERFIFGNPSQVIERLDEFVKAGVRHFVLTPLVQHHKYLDVAKLISEKVIPYFR
ncbi:LLM class flavin-dependent oxidoreductase [Archaeoglobales archaeon]|nr:MAG: LLM class flavin-dependent oxidoreductase [Archaeoglobales archaeon]